jgi:hypothetical protein
VREAAVRAKRDRYGYLKAYRADLARVGLCIDACKRPATRGRRCERCYQVARANAVASQQRKAERGECINCPRRAWRGRRRCLLCTRKLADRDARRALRRRYDPADAATKLDNLTARRAVV